MKHKVAIAIGAHPDDIECCMAGTLLLLKKAGFQIHCLNVAGGDCGSAQHDAKTLRRIRGREARMAALKLGATYHRPITNDLEIVYSVQLLRSIAAVIRDVKPSIVLTHSPQDYMEDHMTTCRLTVTAVFTRGMRNFKTDPPRPIFDNDVTIYHSQPHGLRDGLRRRIIPGAFVNTTSVHEVKREALAAHLSQMDWLGASQKMSSFLLTMERMSREVGRMSKKFKFAEGWRRHLHLGFSKADADPLQDALRKDCLINRTYERQLQQGTYIS